MSGSEAAPAARADARVAPLDDEDLLAVVQDAFRTLIIPELERAGAEEFVVSQVRSCLSIIGFVRRGLHDRQAGRAAADAELAALLDEQAIGPAGAQSPVDLFHSAWSDPRVRELLQRRLALEVSSRTAS